MKVTVVEYLAKKLEFLGIKDVFGLPGDYNFNILDAFIKSKNINWINCTNELNASYAADGYARINGYGAIVTTYGVGELSAINGIAGSYAENVPVMHIVGVPASGLIENNVVVHHNFARANYYVFSEIFQKTTKASAYLTKENAKSEIDRVVDVYVNTRQPVYLAIPVDVCCEMVEDDGYNVVHYNKSDENNLKTVLDEIEKLLSSSKNPVIFVDFLIKRFHLQENLAKFINKTKIKYTTLIMGKGAIDEDNENYIGTNAGNFSYKSLVKEIEESDLIITFGFINADLNTGGFTAFNGKVPDIQVEKTAVKIKGKSYENVLIKDVIDGLYDRINLTFENRQIEKEIMTAKRTGCVNVEDIFPKIETIFDDNDIFVVETGLMSLSGAFLNLKPKMEYLSQTLWGSIGWATPAAYGAMMASKGRNLILFTGEGAHQLTVQELANYFEYDLKPVIFILNNNGYTVERVLSKDPLDKFNNITSWDYSKLPAVFANGKEFYTAKIGTIEDFDFVLSEIKKVKGKKLCYVEIFTDKMDITKFGPKLVSNMKNFMKNL